MTTTNHTPTPRGAEHASVSNPTDESPSLEMALPVEFPVSVVMESRPAVSPWVEQVHTAIAVTIGSHVGTACAEAGVAQLLQQNGGISQHLYGGLTLVLYKDECESYYHNLMSPNPRCYVVAQPVEEDAAPVPFLVSMSFDEAHAYLEGDDDIFDVDIPPEIYKWTEAFVLQHYAPEKKTKRKRKNWSESPPRGRT